MFARSADTWDQDSRGPLLASLGLKDLSDEMPDLAFVCDTRGTLLWAGRACDPLAGQPLSGWVGGPLLPRLEPVARRRALRALARQRRHDEPGFEVVLPVAGGTGPEADVTVHVRRWVRPDGQVFMAGTVPAAAPETAAEPPARVRSGAAARAEAGSLPASEVLATVNREIRAPMNALIGMARLLLQTELSDEQQALADLIWKSGQAALRLVNDACVFTSSEAGQLDLDLIPFDLRVTVDETAVALASLAADRGLELQCRVHPAVPSRLRGDPGRLRQILLNLGERAMQTPGCRRVELLVSRLRESDQSVTLRFLVLGRTASAGDRAAAGPVNPPARPAGEPTSAWGLAVIERLADLMGGKAGIESADGEGGRHWFDVELQKQEEVEPAVAHGPSKTELATKRALVVDSSPVAMGSLRTRLASAGCRVSEAHDAEEALTVLRSAVEAGDPFHFVLIDRDLPGVDGEELGAMIRADHALDVARTLVLTTVGRRGDAARARARGFSAFLPKAMAVDELVDALCEVLRQAMVAPPGGTPELVTRYSLAEARRSKTRVLLVDEDAVNQVVTQWYLRRLGYSLEIADTIADARTAWANGTFDIVMVDEQFTDGDALALARELRGGAGAERDAAFVAMFREEGSSARLAWREAGMGEDIAKPLDLVVLARLLERLTGTGLPQGTASEDECAAVLAVGAAPPLQDRLEIVTPDVDRILSESEVQRAMASAVRLAVSPPAEPVAAEPAPAEAVAAEALPADVSPGEEAEWPSVVMVPIPVGLSSAPVTCPVEPVAADPVPAPEASAPQGEAEPAAMLLLTTLTPEDVQVLDTPSWQPREREPAVEPVDAFVMGTDWQSDLVAEPMVENSPEAPADAPVDVWPVTPIEAPAGVPADVRPQSPIEAPAEAPFEVAPAECADGPMPGADTPPSVPSTAPEEVEPAATAGEVPRPHPHLELVESPASPVAAVRDSATTFDLDRLAAASMGLPSLRQALLSTFVTEINPFLEKLSWMLSDEDARAAAADAHALAVLSRSIGAVALAEALEELERRGAEGTLKANDPVLQRCHGQGLDAAAGVRALLGQQRRAA
jgi:CheY-like chemotaxis protein/HPt (histidine-containing phosphotransfer) domain-containing protein